MKPEIVSSLGILIAEQYAPSCGNLTFDRSSLVLESNKIRHTRNAWRMLHMLFLSIVLVILLTSHLFRSLASAWWFFVDPHCLLSNVSSTGFFNSSCVVLRMSWIFQDLKIIDPKNPQTRKNEDIKPIFAINPRVSAVPPPFFPWKKPAAARSTAAEAAAAHWPSGGAPRRPPGDVGDRISSY